MHLGPTVAASPQSRYTQAKLSLHDRTIKVAAVVESLERDMELLCLTGVEDQLQADVRPTLEMLRNAGIKVRPAPAPAARRAPSHTLAEAAWGSAHAESREP